MSKFSFDPLTVAKIHKGKSNNHNVVSGSLPGKSHTGYVISGQLFIDLISKHNQKPLLKRSTDCKTLWNISKLISYIHIAF